MGAGLAETPSTRYCSDHTPACRDPARSAHVVCRWLKHLSLAGRQAGRQVDALTSCMVIYSVMWRVHEALARKLVPVQEMKPRAS